MILAELEVYHSRPVAPTRRVALGRFNLPVDPPPGFGGILLGGVVARNVGLIDPDLLPELHQLLVLLENGMRVSQPRLRYRLQRDKVGLQRSRHRLIGQGDTLGFEFDDEHGDPTQQVLGAVYAAGGLPPRVRNAVMGTVRRGISWPGPVGPELITALAGFNGGQSFSMHAVSHPIEWALEVLGFNRNPERGTKGHGRRNGNGRGDGRANGNGGTPDGVRVGPFAAGSGDAANGVSVSASGVGPTRLEIQRAYRQLLIEAHPDHGGEADDAAQRIADLTEARRILLG
jgi:hypothetical protein